MVVPPVFERAWWETYVVVNQRFADAAAEVAGPGATVWVQDYQLQLVPAMLRKQRPDLRIGFFLHIPFPPVELFMQLPWRAEIMRGLLGADVVGFQMPMGAQNFLWLARQLLGLEPSKAAVRVRSRPGSVPVDGRQRPRRRLPHLHRRRSIRRHVAARPDRRTCQRMRSAMGDPPASCWAWTGWTTPRASTCGCVPCGCCWSQAGRSGGRGDGAVGHPSRERVDQYKAMRRSIEEQVGRLNGEFGRVGRPIVHYLHQPVDREELVSLYCAADVMVVTPLRDGMNLVCKEYVATRRGLNGVLVLSEFAGAASELTSALLVNPHDLDGVTRALEHALTMDPEEERTRMRTMHRQVMTHDVDRWARSFLDFLDPTTTDLPAEHPSEPRSEHPSEPRDEPRSEHEARQ